MSERTVAVSTKEVPLVLVRFFMLADVGRTELLAANAASLQTDDGSLAKMHLAQVLAHVVHGLSSF